MTAPHRIGAGGPSWVGAVLLAGGLAAPPSSQAQQMVEPPPVKDAAGTPTGFFFEPSVLVSELYDDNLFLTPGGEDKDFLLRVTPGLQAGYRSSRVLLTAAGQFDGERYNAHRDLDTVSARRNASVDLSAIVTPRLTLRVTGGYIDTTTPSELNLLSGIVVGRANARRYEAKPSLSYRATPRGTVRAGYIAAYDRLEGFTSALTQEGSAEYRFDVTPRTFVTTDYTIRSFDFDGQNRPLSHIAAFGVGHAFSPSTLLTARAGPRLSHSTAGLAPAEAPNPEALARSELRERRSIAPVWTVSLRRQLRRTELELTAARTQTTAIGQALVIDTTMAGLSLKYRPGSRVELRTAPSVYRDEVNGATARVLRLAVDLTVWLTNHLSLVGQYTGGYQDGSRLIDQLNSPLPTIRHNVVSIGFRASARRRTPPPEPGIQSPQGQ